MKKHFSRIFIVIFIFIFSFFYWKEYYNFHKNNKKIKQKKNYIENQISNFSVDKIRNINYIELDSTPNKQVLNKIIDKINSAKYKIYLEVYILTEKNIQKALKIAKKRWVEIKIILEKTPYITTGINKKAASFLEKNNIDYVWSNSDNYYFNHSKIILIDNELIISTWNFTHSTFNYNRDFFLFINDDIIYNKLNKVFLSDYNWNKTDIYDNNLILSPNYSRKKIEKLISSANNNIKMYFWYIKDDKLLDLIIKTRKKWIKIDIICSKQSIKSNKEELKKLLDNWINIKSLDKINMHAKWILVDNKYLYLWSINFSTYSLDKNREIWILIINSKIINVFNDIFEKEQTSKILFK